MALGTITRKIGSRASVAAAVAIRRRPTGGVDYLLVRTSDGQRWTFPKGRRERGESLAQTAAREACEEAGVAGRAVASLGTYRYASPQSNGADLVAAFLLDVEREGLPAEPGREPTWFGHEAARSKLAEGHDPGYGEQMERVLRAAQQVGHGVK